ncbi:hypothetical protein ACFL1H_04990 [Nanoarchaeota archaeon]
MKGQVSFEYLMVVGFAFLLIIPAIAIFFSASTAATEQVNYGRLEQIGNLIMTESDRIYYAGGNSKVTLEFNMPDQVNDVEIYCAGRDGSGDMVEIEDVTIDLPVGITGDVACELVFKTGDEVNPSEMVFIKDDILMKEELGEEYISAGLKQIQIISKGDYVLIQGYQS